MSGFIAPEIAWGPITPVLVVLLAAVVGVLVEVPVMLSVVWIVNRSKGWYERGANQKPVTETGKF